MLYTILYLEIAPIRCCVLPNNGNAMADSANLSVYRENSHLYSPFARVSHASIQLLALCSDPTQIELKQKHRAQR